MVTKEELMDIALLAKLELAEEDLDALTADMDRIIAFADTIDRASADTEEFESISPLSNVFREDVVRPSLPQEEILKNVSGGQDGFFPVRKQG